MGADTANPASVYIYDATAHSWSQQTVTTGGFDPSSFNAILDHDTNVFCTDSFSSTHLALSPDDDYIDALSKGELYFLDMKDLKASSGSAISWTDVGQTPYGPTYQPVMALANNHIHFLDVPNVAAGSADIFVIHCACALNGDVLLTSLYDWGQSHTSSPFPKHTHFLTETCLPPMVKLLHSSNQVQYVTAFVFRRAWSDANIAFRFNKSLLSSLMMVQLHMLSMSW